MKTIRLLVVFALALFGHLASSAPLRAKMEAPTYAGTGTSQKATVFAVADSTEVDIQGVTVKTNAHQVATIQDDHPTAGNSLKNLPIEKIETVYFVLPRKTRLTTDKEIDPGR